MNIYKKEYDEYNNSDKKVSEEIMEKALIHYLVNELGYIYRHDITDSNQLKENFRNHFQELNNYEFEDDEFNKIWIDFNKGSEYQRFLRLKSDAITVSDKTTNIKRNLMYFDFKNPKNNKFEIINQLWVDNKLESKSRFDVLLLINGIPIIHIELKREDVNNYYGLNQIKEYKQKEATSDFLLFTRLYIHSNGISTRYFANNEFKKNQEIKTFSWLNIKNEQINELIEFSSNMFNKKFIMNFIENYFIVDEQKEEIKVFRPYQYYACEEIIKRINDNNLDCKKKSGYVWHATGSGKTLTCFKTCEILSDKCKNVDLTIFLIDRNDLDYQTFQNFSNFTTNKNLICNATSTDNLIDILLDPNSNKKIIITTIQKLNKAIKESRKEKLKNISNKRIVFMVDEGHRSQIGEMRKNIESFFINSINIAFTGTPIFDKNSTNGMTTKNIFGDEIHRYRSLDAINDGNVLGFSFNFANSIEGIKENTKTEYEDELNEAKDQIDNILIDTGRLSAIVNYINSNYDKLTCNKIFNTMLACSSIPEAIAYYKIFKETTNLNIGIIFTSTMSDYSSNSETSRKSAEFMLERIKEYNSTWDFNCFDKFKTRIQDDFSKHRKYDILIVVSMLLTGFDSPITNTIFLDKKLKNQAFIQAISRTNRLYDGKQSGNVICFKTDKQTAIEAFDLYTNGGVNTPIDQNNKWEVLEYKDIKLGFEKLISAFNNKYPNIEDVIKIPESDDELCYDFVKFFSKLIKEYNKIRTMSEFNWSDFELTERQYTQLKGKYQTIVENTKCKKIIYVHNPFEIVDFDALEVNATFLRKLVIQLDHLEVTENENIDSVEQLSAYKTLSEWIEKSAKNDNDKILLNNFIKEKDIYRNKISYENIIKIWEKYINAIINKIRDNSIYVWKTTAATIDILIEEFKIKRTLDNDFIDNKLNAYIDDPLFDDDKYVEVKNTIKELVMLNNIKEDVLLNK